MLKCAIIEHFLIMATLVASNPCIRCGKERIISKTWTEKVDTYFAHETARFAKEVVFNSPPIDNKQTTTYAREVCAAEPVVMDPTTQSIVGVPSETIQHANHKVDDFIRRWVRSERHRSGE